MVFAKAEMAPEPRNSMVKIVAWIYATLLVMLTLGQLYAFEKFIPIIQSYGAEWSEERATLLAAFIVTVQVFALPFLLRMPLSPLMRLCSAVCGLAAAVGWLLLSFVALTGSSMSNAAIAGAKIDVSVTVQTVIAVVLLVLSVVSIWGLRVAKKR